VEVCPFDAIKMDTAFELSHTDRFEGLLFRKHQLARSNDYYRSIHPTEAAETDARLSEQRAKAEARKAASPPAPTPAAAPKMPA
jgi:NADH-quinone oxidoreductase subunit I